MQYLINYFKLTLKNTLIFFEKIFFKKVLTNIYLMV